MAAVTEPRDDIATTIRGIYAAACAAVGVEQPDCGDLPERMADDVVEWLALLSSAAAVMADASQPIRQEP